MGSGIVQTVGDHGWQDPRTGLWFENESIARSLGYGQPVDNANTIVQVGSQGSFTLDGRIVTADMLDDEGANNAGYVAAAAVNLQRAPTSNWGEAQNWMADYLNSPAFQNQYVRPAATGATSPVGSSGGSSVSPTAVTGTAVPTAASAAAAPSVNTGGLTKVYDAVALLKTYSIHIAVVVLVVLAMLVWRRKK